ncbi:phosphoribosylglycinamide formyltransferase [Enterovirga sp. CN4-39]|uniref:phosphoribosylglycinamide formyltransferase n=1 Tax=Enterovirga sp. CN4-39 TaxID=3400910 RepID=UPI003BFE0345
MHGGKKRVGVLISGRGSNMASLIEAAQAPDYPAEIALVVSNRPGAGGLARAEAAGIRTATVDHKLFPDRASFDEAVGQAFVQAGVDLICLAGFMRILSDGFVEQWTGRMLNIHPSLLPLFKGLRPHRQALDAGVCIHGCSVHFVVPELDSGPIVAQAAVPVLPGDTEDGLAARVLAEEHRLYPLGLELVAGGQARLEGGRTVLASGSRTALGLA